MNFASIALSCSRRRGSRRCPRENGDPDFYCCPGILASARTGSSFWLMKGEEKTSPFSLFFVQLQNFIPAKREFSKAASLLDPRLREDDRNNFLATLKNVKITGLSSLGSRQVSPFQLIFGKSTFTAPPPVWYFAFAGMEFFCQTQKYIRP